MVVTADELASLVAVAEKATENLDDQALRRIAFEQGRTPSVVATG